MEAFPLGSTQWVVAADSSGRYAGLVSVTDVHLSVSNGKIRTSIAGLLRHENDVLLPSMNIDVADNLFERSEGEALAVLDDPLHRRVVGMLTEAHVLRRYTEELDKARRDLAGEKWLGEASKPLRGRFSQNFPAVKWNRKPVCLLNKPTLFSIIFLSSWQTGLLVV